MYFLLDIVNQEILTVNMALYLALSALLAQPFPPLRKAHANQTLILYLSGKYAP